jgi:hypothetical protein
LTRNRSRGDRVTRIRQARRCHAHRSDGKPCRAWAITGGYVCMAHGGAAPQARQEVRRFGESVQKAFDLAYARWLKECREWQVQRIVTTSMLLDIPPAEVTAVDMILCRMEHGVPGGEDTQPKIRVDRRYGPRIPSRQAPQG